VKTVRDICQYIGSVIVKYPTCIETGTMYVSSPDNEPHNTTNNILEFICAPKEGYLYSLDIDPEHIKFATTFCGKLNGWTYCSWLLGDSVDTLKSYEGPDVDLLCLDSKEFDENHMVNEYNAIKESLAEKHFVLIDDIHNVNSVKWKKLVPLLKELSYSYIEVPTLTGMFVATKGYNLWD